MTTFCFGVYIVTSGFWPRVRARALRAPVFWNSLRRQTGRCAPHPPIAASLLLIRPPTINKIHRTRAARVKGFFLSTVPPRPESIPYRVPGLLSSRPNWVPPTPSPARECCSPPLWIQGGRQSHFRRGWRESISTMGHTLWYSMYTCTLQYNSNPSTTGAVKYNFPRPLPLSSQLRRSFRRIINRKNRKKSQYGGYPAISMIYRENPAKIPVWEKIRQRIPLLL
jgi:hypothetical protein